MGGASRHVLVLSWTAAGFLATLLRTEAIEEHFSGNRRNVYRNKATHCSCIQFVELKALLIFFLCLFSLSRVAPLDTIYMFSHAYV